MDNWFSKLKYLQIFRKQKALGRQPLVSWLCRPGFSLVVFIDFMVDKAVSPVGTGVVGSLMVGSHYCGPQIDVHAEHCTQCTLIQFCVFSDKLYSILVRYKPSRATLPFSASRRFLRGLGAAFEHQTLDFVVCDNLLKNVAWNGLESGHKFWKSQGTELWDKSGNPVHKC